MVALALLLLNNYALPKTLMSSVIRTLETFLMRDWDMCAEQKRFFYERR